MHSLWFDFEQSYATLTMQGWAVVLLGANELLWRWKQRTYILHLLNAPYQSKAPLNNHFIQSKELFMLRLLPPFAQCVCMKSAHSETSLEWGLLSYSSCTAISLSINTVSPDFQPALTGPWEPGNLAEAAEAEERGPKDRWKTRATSHWSESVSFISFGVGYKLKARPPAGTS